MTKVKPKCSSTSNLGAHLTNRHPLQHQSIDRLDLNNTCQQLGLHSVVSFNTRGSSKLDDVLTDIPEHHNAEKLPPIANSDHCAILLHQKTDSKHYTMQLKRRITPMNKASLLRDLASQDWSDVILAHDIDDKVEALHTVVTSLLDKHCPQN